MKNALPFMILFLNFMCVHLSFGQETNFLFGFQDDEGDLKVELINQLKRDMKSFCDISTMIVDNNAINSMHLVLTNDSSIKNNTNEEGNTDGVAGPNFEIYCIENTSLNYEIFSTHPIKNAVKSSYADKSSICKCVEL